MEPIGTITMFYPFLDKKTVELIESILDDAFHYYDFVQKLVEISKSYDMSTPIARFAVIQAWLLNETDIWEEIQPRCGEDIVMMPIGFWRFSKPGKTVEEFNANFYPALEASISARPDDWLLLYLHMIAARLSQEPEYSKNIDIAVRLVEENPELVCFSSYIHQLRGYKKYRARNLEGTLEEIERASEIARECNDLLRTSYCSLMMGGFFINDDPHKALTYLDEFYILAKDTLHLREAVGDATRNMAVAYQIFGEYDMALELLFEDQKWSPHAEISAYTAEHVAQLYCDLELPEQSLEWLKGRTETFDFNWPYLHSAMVRVLVQLDRLDETSSHLETAHKLSLAIGEDGPMMYYLHALGLLELARGNLDEAEDTLQSALQIATELNSQRGLNYCLLALTRLEVVSLSQSRDVGSSGPWMTQLEKHAVKKNYPGIRMQHALLKAEYQEMIGEIEAAQLALQDALTFTDSPGVKTLRKRIQERLQELETSVDA